MSDTDRLDHRADAPTSLAVEADDLIELVDDAVKALSIGGTFQSAEDMRQAVDELKTRFGGSEAG